MNFATRAGSGPETASYNGGVGGEGGSADSKHQAWAGGRAAAAGHGRVWACPTYSDACQEPTRLVGWGRGGPLALPDLWKCGHLAKVGPGRRAPRSGATVGSGRRSSPGCNLDLPLQPAPSPPPHESGFPSGHPALHLSSSVTLGHCSSVSSFTPPLHLPGSQPERSTPDPWAGPPFPSAIRPSSAVAPGTPTSSPWSHSQPPKAQHKPHPPSLVHSPPQRPCLCLDLVSRRSLL